VRHRAITKAHTPAEIELRRLLKYDRVLVEPGQYPRPVFGALFGEDQRVRELFRVSRIRR
jgi:hypothetical protein